MASATSGQPVVIECDGGAITVDADAGQVRLTVTGARTLPITPEAIQRLITALVRARRDTHGAPPAIS